MDWKLQTVNVENRLFRSVMGKLPPTQISTYIANYAIQGKKLNLKINNVN